MSIWIVTVGNSDIILKHNDTWGDLRYEASDKIECSDFGTADPIDPDDQDAGYTVPARVLGLVYEDKEEYYEEDLKFPLLETYQKHFIANNITIDKIIVLLTDQAKIFSTAEQRVHQRSPYWKDTCTLEPLLKWYFQKSEFNCTPQFEYFIPDGNAAGIDNWDATLSLVETKLTELSIDANQEVYVSHQAGTPAASSAVQFVSIGKLKKVKFLVANEYFDAEDFNIKSQSQIVDSSRYQRSLQIQKTKQLIISGFPGAALKILDDLEGIDQNPINELKNLVDFFNLNTPLIDDSEDLTVIPATQRIVDTLDLIAFFFNQKNYLPGIALLAAAHETFLKSAILSKTAMINETVNFQGETWKANDLIRWVSLGLFLDQSVRNEDVSLKTVILQKLKFPVNQVRLNSDDDFNVTNRNFALLAWLKNLDPQFSKLSWKLLEWSCKQRRNGEYDLRNQLMHNLRGVEDTEVVDYLLGYEKHQISDVMTAYNHHVKQPFFQALDHFQLPYKREKLIKKLEKIANSIN